MTTITRTLPQATLHLYTTVEQEVDRLCEKLLTSRLIPATVINKWQQCFKPLKGQHRAFALCELILQMIRPEIIARGDAEALQLLDLEGEATEILKRLLPNGQNAEAFIESYQTLLEEKKVRESKAEMEQSAELVALFEACIDLLYDQANAFNQQNEANFNALQARILALASSRIAMSDAALQRLTLLNQRVDSLTVAVTSTAGDVVATGSRMEAQRKQFDSIRMELRRVLSGKSL